MTRQSFWKPIPYNINLEILIEKIKKTVYFSGGKSAELNSGHARARIEPIETLQNKIFARVPSI